MISVHSTLADVILDWNQELLQAIRTEPEPSTGASRDMAVLHAAMYDAVNAIDQSHASYAPLLLLHQMHRSMRLHLWLPAMYSSICSRPSRRASIPH